MLDTHSLREFLTAMQKTLLISAAFMFVAHSALAGSVGGTVNFSGTAPAPKPIDMSSDPKCKAMAKDPKMMEVVTSGGKLQDAFVYLKNPPKKDYKPRGTPSIDQKGCMYTPTVLGVMEKQKFDIINSDPTLHNVHAFHKRNEFNQAMPKQGQKLNKKFKKKQVLVDIKCDVHKWMHAGAGVMDHPFFAVTNEKGEFEISKALPDGEYEIEAVHLKLGTKSGKVKVAGGNGTVDIAF